MPQTEATLILYVADQFPQENGAPLISVTTYVRIMPNSTECWDDSHKDCRVMMQQRDLHIAIIKQRFSYKMN